MSYSRLGDGSAADRLARDVARQLGSASVRRRSFLRGVGLSAFAVGGASTLAACGTEGTKQTAESCVSTDLSADEKELFFSNWPFYIDVDSPTTLEDFEAATGVSVTYTEDVNDNNSFFAKVRNQLGACEPIDRDIIALTDWMAARMISLGWMQELNKDNLPNVVANLSPALQTPEWDADRSYSVPWQSGLTGIAYNSKYTGEISSMEELLTRPDLKGKVSMLSEMGDTMGFMLKIVGADPSDFTQDEFDEALARLEEVIGTGQIRQFTGNDYTRPLNKGDLVASEAWSGDVLILQAKNPDIKFVLPEEGPALWSDNMMVPNKATHKTHAESLMNYYYDPEVAARLAAYVNYICPVVGAQDAMRELDPSLADLPLIFPSEADLANTWGFMGTDIKTRENFEKAFAQVIGA